MAYTTKSGTVIPSQYDLVILPVLRRFRDIQDPDAVAALTAELKALSVRLETDKYAALRLRGTHEHLGRLASAAKDANACPEFVSLIIALRTMVARAHDALPDDDGFTRPRLHSSGEHIADWAMSADGPRPPEGLPHAEGIRKVDYKRVLEDG